MKNKKKLNVTLYPESISFLKNGKLPASQQIEAWIKRAKEEDKWAYQELWELNQEVKRLTSRNQALSRTIEALLDHTKIG